MRKHQNNSSMVQFAFYTEEEEAEVESSVSNAYGSNAYVCSCIS